MTDTAARCYRHPDRETTLRCNRCERPICSRCALRTPVGYRCRECVRGQQTVFETAHLWDLPIAGVVAALGVFVALVALRYVGYWGLLVAPILGGALAEGVRLAVRRRRSQHLPLASVLGAALGLVPHLAGPVVRVTAALASGLNPGLATSQVLDAVWPLAAGILMISALFYRLRGIRL